MTGDRWKGLTKDRWAEESLDDVAITLGNNVDWEMFAVRKVYRAAMPLDTMPGTRVMDVARALDLAVDMQSVVGEEGLWLTEEELSQMKGLKAGEIRHPSIDSFYARTGVYVGACVRDIQRGLGKEVGDPEMLEVKKAVGEEMDLAIGMGREQVGEIRVQLVEPLARLRTGLVSRGFSAENGRSQLGVAAGDQMRLYMALSDYIYELKGKTVVGWEDKGLAAVEYGLEVISDVTTKAEEAQSGLQLDNPKIMNVMQKIAILFGAGLNQARNILK